VTDHRRRTRAFQLGFLLVVVLLTSGAGFSLWSATRAARRIDVLVAESLERERLIGLTRLDAALLVQAASDHLSATTEKDREAADQAMDVILQEIRDTSERFTRTLPRDEALLWREFSTTAEKLVTTVDVTIKASNRREAERARKHLEEEARPLSFELDDLARRLAKENADDTRELLAEVQAMRLHASELGAAAVGLALILSLAVALQVMRTLRRQDATIAAQLAELNRRNEELDAFASRVAHDLVAPLAPLKGYLTLARRRSEDGDVRELLTQAEASTARVSELVEGLLRFCRAGHPSEGARGELDTAVATVLLEQAQTAQAAGVTLTRALESRVAVPCPPQLLQVIAQNLISNAVKYSAGRPGAHVEVRVRRVGARARLEVDDSGPGIAPETLGQLGQPFFRAEATRHLPGMGLGLATTKRLVEAHGGALTFAARAGGGLSALVDLPALEAPAEAGAPTPVAESRA
jgi:signal transduction histidine kinase